MSKIDETVSQIPGPSTDVDKVDQVLSVLAKDLSTYGSEGCEFCDRECILRFLIARQWNVEKAASQLKKALEWRQIAKPWDMRCDECQKDPYSHNMRQVGTDREGRPVIYTAFSQAHNRFKPQANVQHLLAVMESATLRMRRHGVGKWVWVVDFDGFSARDCDPRTALRTADILAHYPERLHLALLLDAPSLFAGVWAALRAALDPVTAAKVRFVPLAQMRPALSDLFPAELADWLCIEAEENRAVRRSGARKAYWEHLDDAVRERREEGGRAEGRECGRE
jgi:hypothetical protein